MLSPVYKPKVKKLIVFVKYLKIKDLSVLDSIFLFVLSLVSIMTFIIGLVLPLVLVRLVICGHLSLVIWINLALIVLDLIILRPKLHK